jgi:hypothetical protein
MVRWKEIGGDCSFLRSGGGWRAMGGKVRREGGREGGREGHRGRGEEGEGERQDAHRR